MNQLALALAFTLATLLPFAAGCSSPLSASSVSESTITSLSPGSGPVGTQVTIRGSGFSATGNTVTFGAADVKPSGMPETPGVIPNLPSTDGTTIVFNVPLVWRPACSYAPPGPCPIANIPTAAGTYGVSVTSASGSSKALNFTVDP